MYVDTLLLRDINHLLSIREDDFEQCKAAYLFRTSTAMDRLRSKCEIGSASAQWSRIRHYIGRLGSWIKASRAVVADSRQFSLFGGSYQVMEAHKPASINLPFLKRTDCIEAGMHRMNNTKSKKNMFGRRRM